MDRNQLRKSLPWCISFGILVLIYGIAASIFWAERIAAHWLSSPVGVLATMILGVQLGHEVYKSRCKRGEEFKSPEPPPPADAGSN
jgi:uncharacterized membrane protein YbhN (UPF0104 family)